MSEPSRSIVDALTAERDRLSAIIAISADALIAIDEDGRITLFNEGAERIFGQSRAEAIGASLDLLIPERNRIMHRGQLARFAAGHEVSRRLGGRGAEIFGLRKNGDEFLADAAISKIEVGGEKLFAVALRDVTEQRRLDDEQRFLAEVGSALISSLDYDSLLDQIAQLGVRGLADFCVVEVAEAGQERRARALSRDPSRAWVCDLLLHSRIDRKRPYLGRWPESTGRSGLLDQVTPEMVATLAQNEQHLLALRALGPRSLITVPLVGHGARLGMLALVSCSRTYGAADLRLAEQLAERAALAVEHAALYRAAQRGVHVRDDVLGMVAHDLRNPLGNILLQIGLLRRPGHEPDRRSRTKLEPIERSVERMNRLVRNLLDITRLEAHELPLERCAAAAPQIVTEVIASQQALAAQESIELRQDVAPDVHGVWADRDRLLQLFENLVGNAIKFTAPGGHITIGAASREAEILFWVRDDGAGIQSEEVPHLFDRFWQARRSDRRGSGLGLAISKGIVEAHGGRIWVESMPGLGTTVFFTIPVSRTGLPGGRRPGRDRR